LSDFNETWYTASDIERDDSLVTKIEIFIIPDGGGRHLEKSLFWPLLINRLSDFTEILCEETERHVDKAYITKTANF